jgi:DNA modification methylase
MKTCHKIYFTNAQHLTDLPSESIDLIVTSPPYPMIDMWDQIFCGLNPQISETLQQHKGVEAFEQMHAQLDMVWAEAYRVLKHGAFACINIGDATRRLGDNFQLYPNHMRIMAQMLRLGMSCLPLIVWRKQTNAPNKFMGSGTLPAGAYVTLEHEYILIFRKGGKREFKSPDQKKMRRASAFFWEERNLWFSDVWMDLKGTRQELAFDARHRSRSAAFPLELPMRLIHMYSAKGDCILDPFLGMGTTMIAAMIAARNCIGYEMDPSFRDPLYERLLKSADAGKAYVNKRLDQHAKFMSERSKIKGPPKYTNIHYQFPVISRQETELLLNELVSIDKDGVDSFKATYLDTPQALFSEAGTHQFANDDNARKTSKTAHRFRQMTLD